MSLVLQTIVGLDVRLSAAGGDCRIGPHPSDQGFEVARRKPEIEIELANELKIRRLHRGVTGIERLDHTRPDSAVAAVGSANHLDPIVKCTVLLEDSSRSVR